MALSAPSNHFYATLNSSSRTSMNTVSQCHSVTSANTTRHAPTQTNAPHHLQLSAQNQTVNNSPQMQLSSARSQTLHSTPKLQLPGLNPSSQLLRLSGSQHAQPHNMAASYALRRRGHNSPQIQDRHLKALPCAASARVSVRAAAAGAVPGAAGADAQFAWRHASAAAQVSLAGSAVTSASGEVMSASGAVRASAAGPVRASAAGVAGAAESAAGGVASPAPPQLQVQVATGGAMTGEGMLAAAEDTWHQVVVVSRKLFIWGSLLFLTLQLKDFSGIFMGTLVLSVVGNAIVEALEKVLPGRRRLLVTLMYAVTVATLAIVGVLKMPGAYEDAMQLLDHLQKTDLYTTISTSLRSQFGDSVTEQVEGFFLLAMNKPDSSFKGASTAQQRSQALQALLKQYSGQLLGLLATSVAATSRFVLQSVVSLILSFMVVWDLPALSSMVASLKTSRIAPFYCEIAPAARTFGHIFQRALKAQSTIALLNTALTLLGMLMLQVGRNVALSSIVFLCSFVPVAGVIISTVPIGLVALYEGGAMKVALVVLMVVLIHAIEAYILNPFIYSAHLKLHPILTLAVLVVSEHVFGVWGLVTAVPIAVFLVDYVIFRKDWSKDNKQRQIQES